MEWRESERERERERGKELKRGLINRTERVWDGIPCAMKWSLQRIISHLVIRGRTDLRVVALH